MLIFWEPIRGSTSYTRLQIVPRGLYDIIFIAFHSNPIGGHLNAYRTLHRLRLRYHWPEMYSFIKRMCSACPGCALANPTRSTSSELVYHFPIDAPFRVLFVNGYSAGKHSGFKGCEVSYCSMRHDGVLCHGTHPARDLIIVCFGYYENSSVFSLPHYRAGQRQ